MDKILWTENPSLELQNIPPDSLVFLFQKFLAPQRRLWMDVCINTYMHVSSNICICFSGARYLGLIFRGASISIQPWLSYKWVTLASLSQCERIFEHAITNSFTTDWNGEGIMVILQTHSQIRLKKKKMLTAIWQQAKQPFTNFCNHHHSYSLLPRGRFSSSSKTHRKSTHSVACGCHTCKRSCISANCFRTLTLKNAQEIKCLLLSDWKTSGLGCRWIWILEKLNCELLDRGNMTSDRESN